MATLDSEGERALETVLGLAKGDLNQLVHAVREALKPLRVPSGRYGYLYNQLIQRAKRRIRAQQRLVKNAEKEVLPAPVSGGFQITPAIKKDAENHEWALCRGIPLEDR